MAGYGLMLTVACVLRSGPEFRVEHVSALAAGVRQHLSLAYHFICLTDLVHQVSDAGIDALPLAHDWPGWWAKIELGRPGLFEGPVLYLDLDTVICGSIDDIAVDHYFTVLENFWAPHRIGSGLMAWISPGALGQIYRRFSLGAEVAMRQYVTAERWGDQGFIQFNSPIAPERWQTRYPGRIVSYRKHVLPLGRVPEGASVICFGGKARPWNSPPIWEERVRHSDQLSPEPIAADLQRVDRGDGK